MWKVYIDGRYIGIKESNYPYAFMFWSEIIRKGCYGSRFKLVLDDGKEV
jgi:hypothetical protein